MWSLCVHQIIMFMFCLNNRGRKKGRKDVPTCCAYHSLPFLQHIFGSCMCTAITRCACLIVNGHAFLSCFSGLLTAQSALQYLSHPPNHTHAHSYTNGIGCARCLPASLLYLAQKYFDTHPGEQGFRTRNPPISHLPSHCSLIFDKKHQSSRKRFWINQRGQ